MKPQNLLLTLLLGIFLSGCADKEKHAANALYQRASHSFENKQYSLAKLQADSIKLLYPKAFEVRSDALRLLLQIDYAESRLGLSYTDSLLAETSKRIPTLTKGLYFDKDARYQETGTYYAPIHRSEQNTGSTYMRPQVNEHGDHSIVVFRRGTPIEAHTLRFTAPDNTFVEISAATEPYIMTDATGRTERTDFVVRPIMSVGSFISMHSGSQIKVILIGNKGTVSIPFNKADAAALIQVYELATALCNTRELEKQQSELNRRIDFITHRLQPDSIN